jgi:signal transduction histidine kinase
MSHELRSPIAVISSFVDALAISAYDALTAEERADLDHIKRGQRHLAALITQILDYVRAEGRRIEYHSVAVPVEPMLAEVMGMAHPDSSKKQLTLELGFCDSDDVVWADPDRVRQILLNLVGNAIKFSPHGGAPITLDCAGTKDTVLIHVRDHGPGIPSDELPELFKPFVQLGRAAADRQGLGLGLAISRDLARAMQGDLTLESRPGAGCRFTLALPRSQPAAIR